MLEAYYQEDTDSQCLRGFFLEIMADSKHSTSRISQETDLLLELQTSAQIRKIVCKHVSICTMHAAKAIHIIHGTVDTKVPIRQYYLHRIITVSCHHYEFCCAKVL